MREDLSSRRCCLVLLAMIASGCAGTDSGTATRVGEQEAALPPRMLLVAVSEEAPGGQQPHPPGLAPSFAMQLARKLRQDGVPVSVLPAGSGPPASPQPAVLADCVLSGIRAGNQALRLAVGFGAGRARMRVRTTLVDLRGSRPVALTFWDTRSTTGAMPGPVLGLIPPVAAGQALGIAGGTAGVMLGARETTRRELDQSTSAVAQRLEAQFQGYGWVTFAPLAPSVLRSPALAAPSPLR